MNTGMSRCRTVDVHGDEGTRRVFRARRVLVGRELNALDDGAVVIDGTRITRVGPWDQVAVDGEARNVDLGDVTLMPGLIDTHVHLGFDGESDPVGRMKSESDTHQVALMLLNARRLLSAGVTTARDLGSRNDTGVVVRDVIAAGTARGPRILCAGAPLTTTGGHCWFMNAEVDSAEQMRVMVRRHHKAGVDCIKIMSTGGNMTKGSAPWNAQFTEDEVRAGVEEAHRLGMRVAVHAHATEGIRRAVAAGVDSIEHCSFLGPDKVYAYDPDLGRAIVDAGIYVSPTCNCRYPEIRAASPDRDFALPHLYRAGAKIVASTDSGIANTPLYAYVAGLEAMAGFGLPPGEILVSATSRAAESLGLDTITGQIAPGLEADLIAVGGDPHRSVSALRDLRLVMTRGLEFTPDPIPAY